MLAGLKKWSVEQQLCLTIPELRILAAVLAGLKKWFVEQHLRLMNFELRLLLLCHYSFWLVQLLSQLLAVEYTD